MGSLTGCGVLLCALLCGCGEAFSLTKNVRLSSDRSSAWTHRERPLTHRRKDDVATFTRVSFAVSAAPTEDQVERSPVANATVTSADGSQHNVLRDVVSVLGVRFVRWLGADTSGGRSGAQQHSARFCGQALASKPLLLYLPGIEGLGTSVEPQLPGLSEKFDVFRMIIEAQDRSTFFKLSKAVTEFVDIVAEKAGEKTVVVGESFGGTLGLRLGQLRPEHVQCVFAINPATSFGRTAWRSLGPLLSFAPKDQYKAASVALFAATIPDASQIMSVVDIMFDPNTGVELSKRPKALADRLGELWSMISEVSDNLPPATLRWRLQNWLSVGQGRVERGLRDMKVPVTVIAGSVDRLLPSPDEARRLQKIIPGCRTMVLEGHGHAPLFDGRVDLSEIIVSDPSMEGVKFATKTGSKHATVDEGDGGSNGGKDEDRKRLSAIFAKDWVEDFEEPAKAMVDEGRRSIDFLLKSVSPVFFSTLEDGTSVSGLSGVPDANRSRPILFVGNHQLLALDLGVVVERLYSERGILARGLAHPMVFMGQSTPRVLDGAVSGVVKQSDQAESNKAATAAATTPASSYSSASDEREGKGGKKGGKEKDRDQNGMMTFLTKFGAVPVSARNMFRLLQRGDNVLLFPGGVNEAYHKKGEDYKLFWPEKGEFVRLAAAAESSAVIIPFSAVGIADSLEMVLDGDELLNVPFIGERLRKNSVGVPTARRGDSTEQFVPPVVLPKLPSRLYVRFGRPMSLDGVNKKDRETCQQIYDEVKSEVELGIESLLRAREDDPYLDPAKRLLYERVRGEAAPTFEATVLDAAVARTRLIMDGKRRRSRQKKADEALV